eukprot:5158798-Prymnesium_polylepis.1
MSASAPTKPPRGATARAGAAEVKAAEEEAGVVWGGVTADHDGGGTGEGGLEPEDEVEAAAGSGGAGAA